VLVKVCGITSLEDAEAASAFGADYLGLIFDPRSPRFISALQAREIVLQTESIAVGVFTDHSLSEIFCLCKLIGITTVQLHGRCREHYLNLKKAFNIFYTQEVIDPSSIKDALSLEQTDFFLFDSAFQTKGEPFQWEQFKAPHSPWFLAGGLSVQNIEKALQLLTPNGVDLCSGVEKSPGIKDHKLLQSFITKAKQICH